MICCGCFGSDSDAKDTNESDFGFYKDEPSEYVVEKLVIKRIPVRLFENEATMSQVPRRRFEETEEIPVLKIPCPFETKTKRNTTVSEEPCICDTYIKPTFETSSSPLPDKRENVTFASYYSMVPSSDFQSVSPDSIPARKESAVSLETDEPTMLQVKNTLSEVAELELVSKVLNTYSSLFTLDPKEPVPKDPCPLNPPKRPTNFSVYIPEYLRSRLPIHQFTKVPFY